VFSFNQLPTVVKNLLIINALMLLASVAFGAEFHALFAGRYFMSELFRPWQIVTHMFMHGSFMHLFFNMFALFMFGSTLEQHWGSKRFLIYYFVTGIGAFFLHFLVIHFQFNALLAEMNDAAIEAVFSDGAGLIMSGRNFVDPDMAQLNLYLNVGVVGASGAVFGILLAFGLLFPNTRLMLLFPPIPIRAKVFVLVYGAIELMLALRDAPGDNVAHYAHLGGMVFGYFMLKYWQKNSY
jgi:membrane associated rhomboid family serine protease